MIIKVIKKAVKFVTAPLRKVLGWLFKMPDMPDAAAVMVEKQGSDHPIPVVYGTRKIGVIKVHKYVTDLPGGAQNELLHLICVLCEGDIDAIEEVFFDGVSENDPRWRKDKNNVNSAKWFTVHRYLGAANQPASAPAVAAIPNWTNNHTLNGLAYLYVVLQMDKDQSIWRGEPEITARVRGRKIFDPRTNTTAFSTNPAIQLLDYLQNPIYGKGLNQNRLDLPSFIAAANFADETLNSTVIVNGVPTPFSHKRFTGNQVVDTGKSVFSNVQQMLSAMRGSLPIGSGVLRLQLERDTSPVFYFSHGRSEQLNHATITGRIKSSGGSKKDRFNRVVVRFPNAALDFERDEVFYPDSEDPQFSQWLAEDNGVLLEQNFEFNTITNKAEALQMARIIALRSRFQLQCSFVASPAAIVVEPGDVVGITDDTRGWDAKPFRVEQVKLKDDGDVELEFIEHQNAIYPWSGTTYEERTGGTNLGDPTNIPAPTGLFITPDPTFATGGRLSWSTTNNAFIRRFRIQLQTGAEVLFTEETAGRTLDLPLLAPGNYSITVFAVSTLGTLSPPAAIAFELTQPVPPSDIVFTLGNFEIEARPVLAGAGLGTQFEFAIGTTDVVRGRGISMVFTGLAHSTEYTIYARTVNALGVSAWISRIATTTANAANIVDLIGEDIGNQIFDDVVDQVNANLQQVVADATSDLPTTIEVQQLIDDSIELVNAADSEDPFVEIENSIMAVLDEYDNRVEIRRVDFTIAQEGQLRAAAILQLNAADQAIVTQLAQVETNLAGTNSALSIVQGQVNNSTTGLSATFNLAQQANTTANGNTTSISQIQNQINDPNTGLAATASFAQQVNVTANNALSSATAVTNTVNNPTTGLSATNTLAQQAKTTADGAVSSINTINGQINNATTGLSATYTLAQSAKTTADGNTSSITTINNTINNPTTGLNATFTLATSANNTANSADAKSNNNATAIASLQTTVTNQGQDLASAQLTLQSTVNALGVVSARAFLGVTTVTAGRAVINGIVVDGATNTLEFRADTLRLTDTSGNVQLYWDAGRGKFVFNGDIVAGTFQTATSGFRAEMSGTGMFPFWYGANAKTLENALFAVDNGGNVVMRNATLQNVIMQGSFLSASGSGNRVEINADTTYLIWAGSGTKNDANGIFWIKANGTGFIKGDFFTGQIFESKAATQSFTGASLPFQVNAPTHTSIGNTVEVTGTSSGSLVAQGNQSLSPLPLNIQIRRGTTVLTQSGIVVTGVYNSGSNNTTYTFNLFGIGLDTAGLVGGQTYNIVLERLGGPTLLGGSCNLLVRTFEDKRA